MTNEVTRAKLTTPQRMQVLALMARGDTYISINDFLNRQYGITLSLSSLWQIKNRNKDVVEAMRNSIQEREMEDAAALLRRSRRILHRKLDRAEHDMTELEQLDRRYRENEIDHKEYKRLKKTLMDVSITEVSMLSKNMYVQTGKPDLETPPLPSENPRQSEALLKAIQSGDTVELQRIILNPPEQESDPK